MQPLFLNRKDRDQQEEGQQDQIDKEHRAHYDAVFQKSLPPPLAVEAPHRLIQVDEHPQEDRKVRQIYDNMQPFGGSGLSYREQDHRKEELDKGGAIHMDSENAVVDVVILFVPEV